MDAWEGGAQDQLQELKGAAVDKFILQKYGKKWDGVTIPTVPVSALKVETIDFFKAKGIEAKRLHESCLKDTPEKFLDNLKLTENGYLKRAALQLFHPDPERFVTGAFIKIGFFAVKAICSFRTIFTEI